MIDIVTTALRRPELLELTYKSFFGKLKGLPPARIIINIDPMGLGSLDASLSIARLYSDEVVYRVADTPNFSDAINWAKDQLVSKVYIHLEDDWLLKNDISFDAWYEFLVNSNCDQACLLMKRERDPGESAYRFSFRPHLAFSRAIKGLGDIPFRENPEAYAGLQGLTTTDYGPPYSVVDMGRKWAKSQGLKKICDSGEGDWFGKRELKLIDQIDYKLHMTYWRFRSSF